MPARNSAPPLLNLRQRKASWVRLDRSITRLANICGVVENSRRHTSLGIKASSENIQLFASRVAVGVATGVSVFGIATLANPGTGTASARARLYQVCAPSHCRPP